MLFQMDLAGVRRIVVVPPSWEGDRNDVALEAARAYPDRFAGDGPAGHGRSRQPRAGRRLAQAAGHARDALHVPQRALRHFLTEGTGDWLWPAAEAAGVPLMVLMPGMLDHLDRIAAAHPGPEARHRPRRARSPQAELLGRSPAICALAKHPNVALKASGMPSLSTEGYPFRDLHSRIRTLVDAFGPKRTFWGTDLTRMPCSYYECITFFTEHLPWLKGETSSGSWAAACASGSAGPCRRRDRHEIHLVQPDAVAVPADDFREKHRSVWVDIPNTLYDPRKGTTSTTRTSISSSTRRRSASTASAATSITRTATA
jgi:hypothetical protein